MAMSVTISGETAAEFKREWAEAAKRDWSELTGGAPKGAALPVQQTDPAQQTPAQQPQASPAAPAFNPTPAPVAPIQTAVPVTPPPAAAPVTAPPAAPTPAVPVAEAPAYTLEQLGKAGAAFVDVDPANMQKLTDLLARYGVQKLSGLPQNQYGAFATELRQMGAQI